MLIKLGPHQRLRGAPKQLARCSDGLAAVEFALVLPLMLLLFFGALEASDLLTVKRRIANAGNSLADLVSHEPNITVAQLNDSIIGVTRLLEPTDTSTLEIRITSVIKGPVETDPVTVHWSIDEDGDEPYPADSVFAGLTNDETVENVASLIVVELDYVYTSRLTGKVFTIPFEFNQTARRWPRKSTRVQLCQTSDPATCTT